MAGRMAGSNGMSSDESEDQVKEAAAASQSTSSMASVAAAAGLLQGAIPHVQSPVEHPKHPMVQSPAARPPWTTTSPSSSHVRTTLPMHSPSPGGPHGASMQTAAAAATATAAATAKEMFVRSFPWANPGPSSTAQAATVDASCNHSHGHGGGLAGASVPLEQHTAARVSCVQQRAAAAAIKTKTFAKRYPPNGDENPEAKAAWDAMVLGFHQMREEACTDGSKRRVTQDEWWRMHGHTVMQPKMLKRPCGVLKKPSGATEGNANLEIPDEEAIEGTEQEQDENEGDEGSVQEEEGETQTADDEAQHDDEDVD